jgi:hypothetical protein
LSCLASLAAFDPWKYDDVSNVKNAAKLSLLESGLNSKLGSSGTAPPKESVPKLVPERCTE